MSEAHCALLNLPLELLGSILKACSAESLGRCNCVCRSLHQLIASTASLQLRIELYLSGQEAFDSTIAPADVLRTLQVYNKAWNQLSYVDSVVVPMLDGNLWELYGGVLALTDEKQSIVFHRLPSPRKGIPHETWTLADLGLAIRDFGMDASQDLLVLVEAPRWHAPNANRNHRIHLRTISSGKPHPLAGITTLNLKQHAQDEGGSYNIQISGSYIGILVETEGVGENQLSIWEWRTGKQELLLIGDDMQSFVFFSERHVILAIYALSEPDDQPFQIDLAMVVVDFLSEPSEEHNIWEVKNSTMLALPPLHEGVAFSILTIRADPAPDWTPGANDQTPFYTARRHRTYALSLEVYGDQEPQSFILLVPRSTIQQHLDSTPPLADCDERSVIRWEKWGPDGSRYVGPTVTSDPTWVCYVNGTKYVNLRKSADQNAELELFDLNPFKVLRASDGDSKVTEYYETGETMTTAGYVFDEDVVTAYPYHIRTISIPDLKWNQELTAICSEDAILVVDSDRRTFRVLSF